ncbi:MAG: hypothetical protein HY731_01800 [Candidatus Tectomicrobia bacterium]|nr:hypothetical protein [Candidatus Tectomicrobia bacterium]
MAKRTSFGAIILIAVMLTGCAGGPLSIREQFAYGGGALGAAAGAIIGAASGSAATGAVIGGPIGAIGGYLIGDSLQGGTFSSRREGIREPGSRVGGYRSKMNSQPRNRAGLSAEKRKSSTQQRGTEEGGQVF